MSPSSHNGGLVIAMTGKNCVAIAADRRLGSGFQTLSMDFDKVFQVGPRLFIGLPGLATDTLTVFQKLKFRLNMYELRENKRILPVTLSALIANMLYEHRFGPFFVNPIVAGLHPVTMEPFISDMDLIGCQNITKDFVVAGTASDQALGMCEVLWEPDLEPDTLFEKISQALMNSFDRDALSGWGGVVHIIENDKITTKTLKTRMD